MDYEIYMRRALDLAGQAAAEGEVPVGCVVIDGTGRVLAEGRNRREATRSVAGHAELEALDAACRARGDWRLDDCTLFVTVEPCVMCAGAIGWSQLGRLVYGAEDEKRGYHKIAPAALHPKTSVTSGLMAEAATELMKKFFKRKR